MAGKTIYNKTITKFTDIGKVYQGWQVRQLVHFLSYIQPTDYISDYIEENQTQINCIPVLTAGKSFIIGYTANNNKSFNKLPAILFDDFTTDSKYVDFPFQIRSSAAKILIAKENINFNFRFVFYAIQQLNFISSDHKRYWISEYQILTIPSPSLKEQNCIAQIILTWETAITNCIELIDKLSNRKKWLASKLLSHNKSNYKSEKIKLVPLSKLVDRIKNSFIPELEKSYKQIGIRSHCKGIFYKEEVTGKALGNKSVFHIEPNCFIVNIVFAWEHAIAKTTINEFGMIASHRFPMYKPKEGVLDLNYMLHFFKSNKGKDLLELASPGGAGRNKTLGQNEFLKLQIPVPSFERQQTIAKILDKADFEISLYKQKLEQLQLQKKGLMQQLLTGKTRLKI